LRAWFRYYFQMLTIIRISAIPMNSVIPVLRDFEKIPESIILEFEGKLLVQLCYQEFRLATLNPKNEIPVSARRLAPQE